MIELSPEAMIGLSLDIIVAGIIVFSIIYVLAVWLSRE